MNAELILGIFFVFILILFIAGIFLFPRFFGVSESQKEDSDDQNKKK